MSTWRRPGRLVAGIASDWPTVVEERLLLRAREISMHDVAEWQHAVGQPWPKHVRGHRAVLAGGLELYPLTSHIENSIQHAVIVCVYDTRSGSTSLSPLALSMRWTVVPEDGPVAWTADLDGEGRVELALRITHHNGTIEHGTGRAWFRIEDDLRLSELCASADARSPASRHARRARAFDPHHQRQRDGAEADGEAPPDAG